MSKSKNSNPDQPAVTAAKGKKTAPINHVILKRIGDLKTLVADLVVSNDDKAMAGLDLGNEIQKQASEIEALKSELQKFQSGLLGSFCDALDKRLIQSAPVADSAACENQNVEPETSSDSQTSAPSTLPKNFSPIGLPADAFLKNNDAASEKKDQSAEDRLAEERSPGLKEETWESIRSAFLIEHEVPTEGEPSSAVSADAVVGIDLAKEESDNAISETTNNDGSRTHTDNIEDTEDDLDFKHSDIIADLDSLDEDTLRSVVKKQEQLILGLIRRLRTRYNNRPTMTVEQLESVQDLADDTLATEIRETLAVLHSQQRQGELELSLERAKLSRRRTELEQLEARIDGRARTLGVTINDEGALEDAPVADRGTGTKSRRWLGAMGFGNS